MEERDLNKMMVTRRMATGAALASAAAGTLGLTATAASAAADGPMALRSMSAQSQLHNTTAAAVEAEALKLRTSDPERSAILQAAVNAAKQRPGFKPGNAFSISFKLKWDVASPGGNVARPG